ncbi:MAG TPA: class I SAM-dependent methyltransferase [Marinagarivorans sp.]
MKTLKIECHCDSLIEKAQKIAQKLDIQVNITPTEHHFTLAFADHGVQLHCHGQGKQKPIEVNFHAGEADHRRKFGGGKGQMIAKAVGVSSQFRPRVLDATAGLGGDAFVLASLGCELTLQERSPIAYALLESGLARARAHADDNSDAELLGVLRRMHLLHTDSIGAALANIDVIYLDPMFPSRKKSAAVNKSMRAFHTLIGNDDDADQLLAHALNQNVCRIVVKRPRIAPPVGGRKPTYTLEGKSSRFDIYALKKLGGV